MLTTLGGHLAKRLVEIGVTDVFTVPGDFNLGLLDHIIAEPGLNLVGCCNELNAGYAADGYARSKGVGACIVTFTVGGLSIINAIAGAYSENIPIICLVGAPNSNDYGANKIIHHTLGLFDFNHEVRCFQPITCHQAVVLNLKDGREMIDKAISTCMEERKPVYLSISCNLPGLSHPTLLQDPVPLSFTPKVTNQKSLEQAVKATSKLLNKASKPVMIIGPNIRVAKIKALDSFLKLAETCGYPIATMPSAKGLITEEHPQFIGTYWGKLSSPLCEEIVESSDAYIYAGPIFDDITTVGDSLLINMDKAIVVQPYCVTVKNGPTFECILMEDFLQILGAQLQYNTSAYKNNRNQIYNVSTAVETNGHPHSIFHFSEKPLKVNMLFKHIQGMLSSNTILISEAGDSWFHCQRLKFPQGSGYESQMLYASLGWSIGATLGYAQAAPTKRIITCMGDGAFQMTGQEVSTMLRCEQRSIIFLINNGGYSTEAKIHDGPYAVIKNWNYTGLVDSIYNGEGKCWTSKVTTEKELVSAIEIATGEKEDCLCFIEAIIHKHDTSNELLLLGSRLATANSRPPKE